MIRSRNFKSHVLAAAVWAVGGFAASTAAIANEAVTVQLKWVPQSQFAGYYMAAAKGFYKEAGPGRDHQTGWPRHCPHPGAGRQAGRHRGGLDAIGHGLARSRGAAG